MEPFWLGTARAAAMVAILGVAIACSSSPSSHPSSTIGAACSGSADCAPPLFCYTGSAGPIDGQCTIDCTASATSDSCQSTDPNTACLVAGVCGRQCGSGLGCPDGTACVTADGLCERSAYTSSGGGASSSGGSSSGGSAAASLVATGSDANGSVTVTFSGAATSESMAGVYCKLWSGTATPFLEVLGNSSDGLSSAEIKLWNFDLTSGTSRMESFSSTQVSVAITAMLVTSTSGFSYLAGSGASGGSCTTTIETLTDAFVSGTFDCSPLPPGDVSSSSQDLSLTFSCPLQP